VTPAERIAMLRADIDRGDVLSNTDARWLLDLLADVAVDSAIQQWVMASPQEK
jgi:hypothetical protein